MLDKGLETAEHQTVRRLDTQDLEMQATSFRRA